MIERLVRTAVLAAVSLLLLAPPVLAQGPEREPDADAAAKRPLTREQVLRKNPVDPLALRSPVPEMRWLAEQVAAGTTDMRILRAYWRLSNELFPHDKVPPASLRDRALAAKTALEGCRGTNAVPLATGFWVPLGPVNIPGRMTAVSFHPTDPSTVFAAAAGGGVWKTTDLGQNWTPLTDAQATLAIGGLDVDPVDPSIIYAGLGEGNYAIDNLYGNGILKSTDGGANWVLHPMLTSGGQPVRYFHEVKVDPNNRTRVWGATRSGLYLSTDSGVNWTEVSGGLPVIDATSVLPSSKPGSSVVLAGAGGSFGNGQSGFFRSTDGGASWAAIAGMPAGGDTGRIIFAQSPSNPDRIYAAMTESTSHSVRTYYRSDDEGATWTAVGRPNTACNGQCWYNLSLAVDAGNPDVVYSGQVSLYRSLDAGATWARVSSTGGPETYVHVDHHWLNSPAPGKMLAASDGGVYLTNDQGATWDFTGLKLLTGQYYHMTTHPIDDNYAIGGTQDNGTHRFAGTMSFDQVIGGDGAWTAIDWVDPAVWYGSYIYLAMYRSRASGAGFVGLPMTGVDPNEPVAFIAPFALDRGNPSNIFGCTSRLYRSTDQGDTWTAISPPLPADPTRRYINAVDNCRDVPATIWAGTNDGKVWNTTDGGTNWIDVTGTLPVRSVTSIAVHPTLPGTAYLTLAGTGTGHVWKTTDSGASWTDVSTGLPDITHRHVLLIPDQPSTLIAATDLGVYRSDDAGQSWYVYGSDLPNVAVNWLGFSTATGTIRAATHGRGMWQLVPANTCPFVPEFAGLESITVVSVGGECKPQLDWQPAMVTCTVAPGLSYNVYRSTDPLFVPGPASLLQAGVTALSYRDLAALPGIPYYYVVKAEDGQTGYPGPANGGKEDLNRRTALIELGDPFASGGFADPGGDGNAWMQSSYWSVDNLGNTTPAGQFSYRSSPGRSPAYTIDACAAIETPDMVLGPAATLTYQASYNIEYQWDGVVVEISTDRGVNWIDVPPAGGYPSDLSQTQGNGCNMPAARPVFNGPTDNASLVPFQLYTHDLATYAGQTARIRFVLTTDAGAEFEGFLLDDVAITPATGTGAGCGCATNPTTVVANRLLVGQQASGNPRFVWTSLEPTGTWNLHATADPTQIGTLHSNGASVVSGGATVKSIDDDGSFPLGYYQIYGADCTGTSVP